MPAAQWASLRTGIPLSIRALRRAASWSSTWLRRLWPKPHFLCLGHAALKSAPHKMEMLCQEYY